MGSSPQIIGGGQSQPLPSIDLSGGFVPNQPPSIDLSDGFVPTAPTKPIKPAPVQLNPPNKSALGNIAKYPENQLAPDPEYVARKRANEAVALEPGAPEFQEDPEQERRIRAQEQVTAGHSMIPDAAVPALQAAEKYAITPFEKIYQAGTKSGATAGEAAVSTGKTVGFPARGQVRTTGETNLAPPVRGISRAVGGTIGGMLDPRMWPFFLSGGAAPGLQRLATAGFAGQMGHAAYEQAGELGKIMDNPDVPSEDKWESGANLILSTLMAAQAGAHASGLVPHVNATIKEFDGLPPEDQQGIRARLREKAPDVAAEIDKAAGAQAGTQQPDLSAGLVPSQPEAKAERFRLPRGVSAQEVQGSVKAPNIRTVQVGDKTYAFDQRKTNADGVTRAVERGEMWRLTGGKAPEAAKVQAEQDVRGEEPPATKLEEQAAPPVQWDNVPKTEEPQAPIQQPVQAALPKEPEAPVVPQESQPAKGSDRRLAENASLIPEQERRNPDNVRRQPENAPLRKTVDQMTPEEKDAHIEQLRHELSTSEKTGLPNRRAFDEQEPSPAVGMSDADGLKALNDKFGYDAGDALLKAKAEALQEAGLDAYHEKGDEFLYRGDSPESLKTKLESAREILKNRVIQVETKDGKVLRFKGADFSYGTGNDLTAAESGLKEHKSTREAAGERARGELRGIAEVRPEERQEGVSAAPPERPAEEVKPLSTQIAVPSREPIGGRVQTPVREPISTAKQEAPATAPAGRPAGSPEAKDERIVTHEGKQYRVKLNEPAAISVDPETVPFDSIKAAPSGLRAAEERAKSSPTKADYPPLTVIPNGDGTYFLDDGFHRYSALSREKPETVKAFIKLPPEESVALRAEGKAGSPEARPAEEAKVVPGGRSPFTGNETGMNEMQQLTNSIAANTKGKTLRERLQIGADTGQKASPGSGLSELLGRLKGRVAALWDAYKQPPRWGDYETSTGRWSGAEQASALDLDRFTRAIKQGVRDKGTREAMSNWIEAGGDDKVLQDRADKSDDKFKPGYEAALDLTDEQKTIARNIMGLHDATLAEAKAGGLLEHGVENYIQHVYSDKPKFVRKIMAEMNFNSLNPKPSFTKQRTLPTYFDAEQLGFTPKDKDVAYLTAIHERSLREALAARAYVKSLMEGKGADGRPLVATSWASAKEIGDPGNEAYVVKPNLPLGEEHADYRKIDHPALRGWKWSGEADGKPIFVQGDALVHPEIYRKLKNNLSNSALRSYEVEVMGHAIRPGAVALDLQNQVKQFILSFSGFHQTTLGLHALEHRTRPALLPELDLNDAKQGKLVDHGLMVAHYDAEAQFSEGVAGGGVVTKIPGIGPLYNTYREYLFKSYLPRVKMQMALNALDRNMEAYKGKLSEGQIYAVTANQANAAFGGLNYKMLGRNKTLQDTLRLGMMAPDFTEARGRFAGQALKPYGREQRIAFLGGALALYTVARLLNEELDKKPHWDKPFSVIHRGKEYSLRSVQGDVLNLLEHPLKFFGNRLSPIPRAMTGQDELYQKKNQKLPEKLKQIGSGFAPIPAQPWLQNGHNSNAQKAMDSILKMVGVSEKKEDKKH